MPRALTSQETPNDITQTGVYIASGGTGLPYGYGVLIHIATANQSTGYNAVQTLYKWDASQSWQRTKVDGTWKEWIEIALSIPSFYKNYATFQGLVSAITGDIKWNGTTHLPADADNSIDVSTLGCGLYTVTHGRKILGHPSEISSQVTLIIRTTYSSTDKSTILIPIEAGTGVGIWAKYKDSIASFAKVV